MKIDNEVIRYAVRENYNLVPIDLQLIQDKDDLVYQLLTNDNRKYSLKIHRKKVNQSDKKISSICEWLEFASCHLTFDLPFAVRNYQKNFLSPIKLDEIDYTFTIYHWVNGVPVSSRMTGGLFIRKSLNTVTKNDLLGWFSHGDAMTLLI